MGILLCVVADFILRVLAARTPKPLNQETGEVDKRAIGYTIAKNRGRLQTLLLADAFRFNSAQEKGAAKSSR